MAEELVNRSINGTILYYLKPGKCCFGIHFAHYQDQLAKICLNFKARLTSPITLLIVADYQAWAVSLLQFVCCSGKKQRLYYIIMKTTRLT